MTFARALLRSNVRAMKTTAILLFACIGSGCAATTAIVDGKVVPRLETALTGQPYIVRHHRAHPKPGGPSDGLKDEGGDIVGRVCGMDIDFSVKHEGDQVSLGGFIDNEVPAQLVIKEKDGVRTIVGGYQVSGGLGSIDLTFNADSIKGNVGIRIIDGKAVDDTWQGKIEIKGFTGEFKLIVNGRATLLAMTAAQQAAILPAILTCYFGATTMHAARNELRVGFGGEQADLPPMTNSLYDTNGQGSGSGAAARPSSQTATGGGGSHH